MHAAWECFLYFLLGSPSLWDQEAEEMYVIPREHPGLCGGLHGWLCRYLIVTRADLVEVKRWLTVMRWCSRGLHALITQQFQQMKERPRIIEIPQRHLPYYAFQFVLLDVALVAWCLQRLVQPPGDNLRRLNLRLCRRRFRKHCRDVAGF